MCIKQTIVYPLLYCIVVFLIIPQGALCQTSISTLWKARALESADRLKDLQARLNKVSKSDWNSKAASKLRCEVMLETAYALHVTSEETVHKTDNQLDFFHIMLSGGKEAGLFDIMYIYSSKGELLGTRIDMLPKDWQLIFLAPIIGKMQILLPKGSCLFQFNLEDPFANTVLE